MELTERLSGYKSCAVIGMEKNTGKTECLNHILAHYPSGRVIAVTSIGVDGERSDRVTETPKPEIFLREGVIFSTSETHYRQRRLDAEILGFSNEGTSLGRIVIARTRCPGKVMLSGPSTANGLRRWMGEISPWHPDFVLVDGALSRRSSASPAITEALVLTTGAAYSLHLPTLLRDTALQVEWIRLPETDLASRDALAAVEGGMRVAAADGEWYDPGLTTALNLRNHKWPSGSGARAVFFAGAFTDAIANALMNVPFFSEAEIVVRDFTRIFLSPQVYRLLVNKGFRISVLWRASIAAICVNPHSPTGYVMDSERLCAAMAEAVRLPVYDLRRGTECFL